MRVAQSVSELIGKTPIVKLNRIVESDSADVYLKLEFMNPGSSVKDRIALAMIEDAEKKGLLKEGDTIIEPTSGNTGIGLAMVAAAKGYKAILVMPETMSIERRNLLRAYGAELVLTPGPEGMGGAIRKATELAKEHGYFIPQQFQNQSNPEIHRLTTGPEIVEQMGDQLDAFIAGIGTGGTITGAGEVLKEAYKDIKIYAVEPADSPVLSGGKPGPHKIQGIGAGFIPETLDVKVYDEIIQVKTEQAFEYARRVAKEEGILVGISSGAVIYAATEVAKKLGKGKKVLVIIPSNGERYLSTPLYQFES
ncbi:MULTISPECIES: cysteine synthase A [Bacillus]|uniref:Cysteine synthase n=2 Tax=Bacillus toyonensis TaxID=155322 RepID=A0A1V6L816_9BACI|nr:MULTISPECIES: cysteine synthase A [Bacillus]EEL61150.2 Type III pantothenate kinase [Bacillus cereus Rock4-18]EOP31964.1 cysteine synthase [Bacillus cereus VD131]KAB0450263.1 cysteine synthase A [Lysinibacillus sp. VIA-II-2016]KNH41225.1 cysteine synthase [Bacillus thuringiensis]KXY17262.1 cysteine synthase [Bacillus cereus]MDH8708370.1 cysteine synthase A [Stenotrophomonas sp. 1198]OTX13985.1 cysteine synthase A [Bacillus thuringiensis serovar seoulensis]OTX42877.1 cysteine synthase A [